MAYINAAKAITPHETFLTDTLPDTCMYFSEPLKSINPDFKQYFSSIDARRTNRLIKTAHVCAVETMKLANIESPDAIITATGLGCVNSTERFLNDVLKTNEGLLAPTSFIQSTANAVGGHHAIHFKCNGYNVLHAQKSLSFENALLDSLLQLESGEANNILLGGFDEITEENYNLKEKIGIYKASPFSNQEVTTSNSDGAIPGEGTCYFLLSNKQNSNTLARVENTWIHYGSMNTIKTTEWVKANLDQMNLTNSDIDLVIAGYNGDHSNNANYTDLLDSIFKETCRLSYKQLCGEYDTASSFAMWLGTMILKKKQIPEYLVLNNKNPKAFNKLLVVHQVDAEVFSMILLSAM